MAGERAETTRAETTLAPEKRTTDHIPVDERHGRGRDLFTLWFGLHTMLLTVATGVVGGGRVMALHAGQGRAIW